MDVSQIASVATGLNNLDLSSKINTTLLKKTLDNQQTMAASLLEAIPSLPANPAIGRNINITV